MNLGLEGRVALVSGASQGLGRAVALALAQEGARVALCSRDPKRARAAAAEIAARTGAEILGSAVDVNDPKRARWWVDNALKKWGRVDILVNNAGGPAEGGFEDVGESEWRKGFEQNLLSFVRLSRLAAPAMKKRCWGRIVFIASTSAKQPIEGLVISNALRAGILGLAKTMSQELGPHGINVNTVCPGYTTTERLNDLARHVAARNKISLQAVHERWANSVPLRRLAEPREVAAAVAYLCSQQASYVTGAVLQVDGGRTASPF